jgi:hypothetical protein
VPAILLMLGNIELIQTEGSSQDLLGEVLFGEHGGHPVGPFSPCGGYSQNELLNLA